MTVKKYILTANDVEDNLTSTLGDVPLSANQGRVLNTGKVDKNQGTAQAGKVLGIGADGLVYAMNAGTAAHASTHASGGSDAVSLAASQITSGTLSADRLPKASTSAFGAVKVGSGLSVSGGVISASGGGIIKMNVADITTSGYAYLGNQIPLHARPFSHSGHPDGNSTVLVFPYPASGTITLNIWFNGGRGQDYYVGLYKLDGTKTESVTKWPASPKMFTKTVTLSDCVMIELARSDATDVPYDNWKSISTEELSGGGSMGGKTWITPVSFYRS